MTIVLSRFVNGRFTEAPQATYRPLRGNRYKSNQTGGIVSKKNLNAHRSMLLQGNHSGARAVERPKKIRKERDFFRHYGR